MSHTSNLTERFPATYIEDIRLHIFPDDGDWQVWVNSKECDFTGLCVGVGESRKAAVQSAVIALSRVVEALQMPDARLFKRVGR